MAVIDLCCSDLRFFSQNLWLVGKTSSAGPGLDGRSQVLVSENRIWRARLDLTAENGPGILKFRQMAAKLNGRAGRIRMCVNNFFTPRYNGNLQEFYDLLGISPGDVAAGFMPFSDSSTFSDGTGFALPSPSEPRVSGSYQMGKTQIAVSGVYGEMLQPGAYFSINDFLYIVEENSAGLLTFSPPLREAIAIGDTVNVSAPKIQVRLSSDSGFRPEVENFRRVKPMSLDLEEAFERD